MKKLIATLMGIVICCILPSCITYAEGTIFENKSKMSFKKIERGSGNIVGLTTDGRVVAWGANDNGQSEVPKNLIGVKEIATGTCKYSLSLKYDGTVVAFGAKDNKNYKVPEGMKKVKAIKMSGATAIAFNEDDTVKVWGEINCSPDRLIKTGKVYSMSLSSSNKVLVALDKDGNVLMWDNSGLQNTPEGLNNVKELYINNDDNNYRSYAVALKYDGSSVIWGNGEICKRKPSDLADVKDFAFAYGTVAALKRDGSICFWNSYGKTINECTKVSKKICSDGVRSFVSLNEDGTLTGWSFLTIDGNPTKLPFDNITNVKDVILNSNSCIILKNDGSTDVVSPLYASDESNNYQNRINEINQLKKWKNLKTVYDLQSIIALDTEGQLLSSGFDEFGLSTLPGNLDNVIEVGGTNFFTAVLKGDSTVQIISNNNYKSFPSETSLYSNVKKIVSANSYLSLIKMDNTVVTIGDISIKPPEKLKPFKEIITKNDCTIALNEDGTINIWGSETEYPMIKDLNNVEQLVIGDMHIAVLKKDGTVECYGYNEDGRCDVPKGLKNVKSVVIGYNTTAAIKEDKTVVIWGKTPNNGDGITNVKNVYISSEIIAILKEDGTVISWAKYYTSEPRFQAPEGLKDVANVFVSGNFRFVIAIKKDGSLVSWGIGEKFDMAQKIPDGIDNVKYLVGLKIDEGILAVGKDGALTGWSNQNFYATMSVLNYPKNLKRVKLLSYHDFDSAMVALLDDSTLVSWGHDNYFIKSNASLVAPGDVNSDLIIDSADYMILRRHLLGIEHIKNDDLAYVADLNGDKIIDTADYYLLKSFLLEKIKVFPVNELAKN